MNNLILLTVLAIVATLISGADVMDEKPCKLPGFYPVSENSSVFYGCYANKYGGLTLKYLTCVKGEVFSSKKGYCIPKITVDVVVNEEEVTGVREVENPTIQKREIETTEDPDDVENPTIPTRPTEQDAANEDYENVENPTVPTKASETADEDVENPTVPTQSTDTETEVSGTNAPSTIEPETDAPPTGKPSTENPETDVPSTTEHETEVPATDQPSTEVPKTNAPSTIEPETDAPPTTTEVQSTTETPVHGFPCPTSGFFPQNGSCAKFNLCIEVDGEMKAYLQQCPKGQNFYPIGGFCTTEYSCEPAEEVPSTEVPSKEPPTFETSTEVENESGAETTVSVGTAKMDVFDCLVEGTFSHANDCSQYYQCNWDKRIQNFNYEVKQCAKNQVYNTLTGSCGREGIITCLGRPKNSKFVRI